MSLKDFKHISYSEKIKNSAAELKATKASEIIKRGRKKWDETLGGIYGWKIYTVGADTGVGKTTFVNQIALNISIMWHKTVKYSLEDRMEDIWKEEIYYTCNKLRAKDGLRPYLWTRFVNNDYEEDPTFSNYVDKAVEHLCKVQITELEKTKKVWIKDLVDLMEQEIGDWAKVFFIDHLHYFEFAKADRRDLIIEDTMHKINEVARKYNITVFLIAHYRKMWLDRKWSPSYDLFKDWAAIKQVSNIIIQITREIDEPDGITEFHITKLRGPIKPQIIEATFNINTYEYDFEPTQQLKEAKKSMF